MEEETLVLEPPRAEVEGVIEETALEAPVVVGAPVSEPTEARDEVIVAVVPAPTAQGSVVAVVELPDNSEEYGDSMDIDPAAAASAAAHIAEFASASADVLKAGTSEGPHHGAIARPGSPRSSSAKSKRRRRPGTRSSASAARSYKPSTARSSSIRGWITWSAR